MTVQMARTKTQWICGGNEERKGEREREMGRWLLSPCPLHHPISAKLNVRMTDAAHQQQVREVKSRSIH